MGSDNLFHKRKARKARDLARRKASRKSYERVLVVCEGAKTEPNYLGELIDCLKLSSANVEVNSECGSAPINVVEHAKSRYREEKDKGDTFDRVFCVFDKDSHTTFAEALRLLDTFKPASVFSAIPSVPCFEYWLLLHFDYSDGPYSACSNLIGNLKNYMPHYSKGDTGVFTEIMSETERAIAFSKRALRHAENTDTDNPTTMMHVLVEYLQQLKQ